MNPNYTEADLLEKNRKLALEIDTLKKEIADLKKPVTLNHFLYDFEITENDEISCELTIHKIPHTLLICRKDVKSFANLYRMKDFLGSQK